MAADTIAAVATPPGRGGIGIIRVSGPDVTAIAQQLLGKVPKPRYACFGHFTDTDKRLIDQGLAFYFPAPHSFTGEHVLELHGHGGPVTLDLLLNRMVELGARLARPGEFTERAFLNDKIDLAQAEAVADLIEAGSAAAARAAANSLVGVFSERIQTIVDGLIILRVAIEAAIDFPEEEIDFLADETLQRQHQTLSQQLATLLAEAGQGQRLRDGMTIVIAGRPNAGKSSLLNRLAGQDRAIVTDLPGTTRDVLREVISIDGMPLHVIDTAGLRDSNDPIEQEGIRRAWREIKTADRVLLVIDQHSSDQASVDQSLAMIGDKLPSSIGITCVYNKIDLDQTLPASFEDEDTAAAWVVKLSAKTGAGIELLRQHLKACSGYQAAGEGEFIARRRHIDALKRAEAAIAAAGLQLKARAGELAAEELRLAQQALGEITGEFTADDLLGRIFSSFCIGK